MKAVFKVSWGTGEPVLKLATADGFEEVPLEKGLELDLELTDERRCVGYFTGIGEHEPCPDFSEVDSGDQCYGCRKKDVYAGWAEGSSSPGFDADYSVYLAQCGSKVKVGVARSGRLENRWLEQGADYAVEIFSGLTDEEALEREKQVSGNGIRERVNKKYKAGLEKNRLPGIMDEHGFEGEIVEVHAKDLGCSKVARKGRFPSPIDSVKGQLVSNGKYCLALTSGRVLKKPVQQGLDGF